MGRVESEGVCGCVGVWVWASGWKGNGVDGVGESGVLGWRVGAWLGGCVGKCEWFAL
jgi:hypothetical protein